MTNGESDALQYIVWLSQLRFFLKTCEGSFFCPWHQLHCFHSTLISSPLAINNCNDDGIDGKSELSSFGSFIV